LYDSENFEFYVKTNNADYKQGEVDTVKFAPASCGLLSNYQFWAGATLEAATTDKKTGISSIVGTV